MGKKQRFSVFSRDDEYSNYVSEEIIQFLISMGFSYDRKHPELLICVGGDGTILRAIHKYYELLDSVCIVGFHTGTLGFLTDFSKTDLDQFLYDLVRKDFEKEYSTILDIDIEGSSETLHALNEVRLGSFSKTVNYSISIDGEFFENTVGSGICISTQAGSTAANRALMGAVVDDGLDILQLCEIMPVSHRSFSSLKNPYIMNSKRIIRIYSNDFGESELSYDHLTIQLKDLPEFKRIEIKASNKKVCFARYRPYSYFKRLKNLYYYD